MRPLVAVSLLCLVVLAGCMGSAGGGETPTATAQQETATQTPTVTAVTTTTPAVPPNATNENTVNFGNLSERQQGVFLDALDGKVIFAPESPQIAIDAYDSSLFFDVFSRVDYVRYRNAFYRIEIDSNSIAYTSQSYTMNPATPGPNETVVAFENLSASNQEMVRTAIETGEYTIPYRRGAGRPSAFQISYIEYQGEVYAPKREWIADAGKYEMRVEKYGNATESER